MDTGIYAYYYNSALKYASDGHLSRALELCAVAWGIFEAEEVRKLAGLCYFAIGNYTMADYCFSEIEYYNEKTQRSVKAKIEFADRIKQFIDSGKYRNAVKALRRQSKKSAAEFNMLGCLYARKNKKNKAMKCFARALKINKDGSEIYVQSVKQTKKTKKRWFR
jgi:tetratricopeptide (TPR) repeat protein